MFEDILGHLISFVAAKVRRNTGALKFIFATNSLFIYFADAPEICVTVVCSAVFFVLESVFYGVGIV